MTSILTNTSAISAVASLAATQKSLAQVQNQISTGLKVSSAEDNAAYYSIATDLRTQIGNLGAVSDSLNLGSSVVGTATAAVTNLTSILQSFQAELVAAKQPGTNLDSINTNLQALDAQLANTVTSASFNGVNLIDGSNKATPQVQFVAGVTGLGATTAVTDLTVDTTNTNLSTTDTDGALVGVVAITLTSGTGSPPTGATASSDIDTYLQTVGTALEAVNTASETFGAAAKNIDLQSTFTTALSNSITTGVGSLVDADLNEASTRLSALQTQQQLGIQSLSIANSNTQTILKLFQ